MRYFLLNITLFIGSVTLVASHGYYSVLAPGYIKSNRNYTVFVTLHHAPEATKINIMLEGPTYEMLKVMFLQPFESRAVTFLPPKLTEGHHRLSVEGVNGLRFRNETMLTAFVDAGPKIYIQTDKAIYKPGDEVQFRVVLMNEHTRPLNISEPIRIEIMDGNANRVKQFKDISLVKGVYKNKFQLSEYPVMGLWQIRVYISGRYDFATTKTIKVQKYLLPKFSLYVETPSNIILGDPMVVRALIYGQYTFGKYVEGQVKIRLLLDTTDVVVEEKEFQIKDLLNVELHLNHTELIRTEYHINMHVELKEKHTGRTRNETIHICTRKYPYQIYILYYTIKFAKGIPYQFRTKVRHWNDLPIADNATTPLIMEHGNRNYSAFLDANGEATYQFEHDPNSQHIFRYGNTTHISANIFHYLPYTGNATELPCKLELLVEEPKLGSPVQVKVTSLRGMPYLVYTIVGHANIIHTQHIELPTQPTTYVLEITPSIEMVPYAFVYVHYIDGGNLRYGEIKIKFPLEFENEVSIMAPKQVKPGADVTLEVKAQPKSLVGILAVDLGVYLLDSSYDLQKNDILYSLEVDTSGLPFLALVYPGLLSGLVTLTNAHYEFVPLLYPTISLPTPFNEAKFRKNFPETWIFENYEITNDTTQLTLKIPDTITTWRLTAFSMNEKTGFGIVHGPTDITTIQPFFISLNLPYSVKRGEIVAIPIQIHNYLNVALDTDISLINAKEEFYFMESTIFNRETGSTEQQRTKRITMPMNGVDTVSFLINPRQSGYIELKITAKNRLASDGIIEKLRVEPEGIQKEFNKVQNINVIPSTPVELSIPLTMHSNMVLQSEVISLSVVGDNMAPVLLNLNDLVNLPTGCGEQNMADFAPNVLALQYLKLTGQYHREAKLVSKAKRFIEIGYQQQLTYRHDNGAYSVFGQRQDLEASTWLTAYTIRFFIKSLKYAIPIERHIIESGLDYLATAQREDGSFPYTGYLIDPSQQNRFGFTAFILMTFLEDEKLARKHPTTIRKGLNFLSGSMNRTNDMCALSIMAVTLQMAKNYTTSRTILDKIMQRKKSSHDLVWWSQNDRNMAKDVEITGYVLMAMLEIGYSVEVAKKAFNWLTQQRNAKGGFQSSQDTVVGVEALIKYSVKYRVTGSINVTLNYRAMDNDTQIVKTGDMVVDARNMKIVQMEELPKTTRAVKILATGFGNCSLQLTYQYYTNADDSFQYFQLAPKVELLNPAEMSMEICFSYIEPDSKATNMVVMEVNLPSGFSGDERDMDELLENEIVQRIEMKNSETTIIVYSAQLMAEEKSCLSLMAYKMHDVVYRKPAAIIINDYYNISRHDTVFYKIVAETAQDHSSKVENTPITLDNKNSIF